MVSGTPGKFVTRVAPLVLVLSVFLITEIINSFKIIETFKQLFFQFFLYKIIFNDIKYFCSYLTLFQIEKVFLVLNIDILVQIVDILVQIVDILVQIVDILVQIVDILVQVVDILVQVVDILVQVVDILVQIFDILVEDVDILVEDIFDEVVDIFFVVVDNFVGVVELMFVFDQLLISLNHHF